MRIAHNIVPTPLQIFCERAFFVAAIKTVAITWRKKFWGWFMKLFFFFMLVKNLSIIQYQYYIGGEVMLGFIWSSAKLYCGVNFFAHQIISTLNLSIKFKNRSFFFKCGGQCISTTYPQLKPTLIIIQKNFWRSFSKLGARGSYPYCPILTPALQLFDEQKKR